MANTGFELPLNMKPIFVTGKRPEIADLAGRRLFLVGAGSPKFSAEKLKGLVSGDPIAARKVEVANG